MREWGASDADIQAQYEQWAAALAARAAAARYEHGVWRTPEGELLSYDVLPCNAQAWAVFRSLATQWETPGAMGGRCTVPLTDVDIAVRRMVPQREQADCWGRLQLMITVARNERIEQLDRERTRR